MIIATFFATWFGLRQLDWMTILRVDEVEESTEEKLGKLYWDVFRKFEQEETDKEIMSPVDSLLSKLCRSNHIDRGRVKLHVVRKDEINAFALPDNHLVLFTGLIDDCVNEAELCGVIAHELAHMENGHIMRKLVKEIGLSVLVSMTAGNGSTEVIREAVRILSSTAYDRNLERDADMTGVDYLINAGIDPQHFANFLYRMAAREKDLPNQVFWVTSHPGSEERSMAILEKVRGKIFDSAPVVDSLHWQQMKQRLILN